MINLEVTLGQDSSFFPTFKSRITTFSLFKIDFQLYL